MIAAPVRWLRRLLGREGDGGLARATPAHPEAPETKVAFQDLYRQLETGDPRIRYEAASIVSALAPPSALRPLTRAYVRYGDRFLLDALRVYGEKLTLTVGRDLLHATWGPTERARLLDILGASGDRDAIPIVRRSLRDLDPAVHVAGAAALVRLGERLGVEHLEEELLSIDPDRRLLALRATRDLDHPAVAGILEQHLERYLAEGGAVPPTVAVALPMLFDPEADLPGLITRHVRRSPRTLTIVIGPQAAVLAETRRGAFAADLPDHHLYFTTPRHSPPEQLEVLTKARDRAAGNPGRPVALIGDLPSPGGPYPPPHFLTRPDGDPYSVRVVFVGEQEFAVVMEWWYYIADRSEVPTDFEVVLTALQFGAEKMSEEEAILCRLAGEARREAFARALLAHQTTV